jgi:antitoxin (DNA-binding transcriptional repressor) of toxin-antitoxin stability system
MAVSTFPSRIPTNISAMQARQQLGTLMDKAVYQGRSFIVERAGEAAIAIVPITQYRQMMAREQAERDTFFALVDEAGQLFFDKSEDEVRQIVDEAVSEVRAEAKQDPQREM